MVDKKNKKKAVPPIPRDKPPPPEVFENYISKFSDPGRAPKSKSLSLKQKKQRELDEMLKEFREDVGRYEGHEAGKKMATDEFSQSMKKPGAIDKYAGQAWEKARSKRVKEKRLEDAINKGILDDLKKGKTPVRKAAKGGYVKKYAKGGGVRAARY